MKFVFVAVGVITVAFLAGCPGAAVRGDSPTVEATAGGFRGVPDYAREGQTVHVRYRLGHAAARKVETALGNPPLSSGDRDRKAAVTPSRNSVSAELLVSLVPLGESRVPPPERRRNIFRKGIPVTRGFLASGFDFRWTVPVRSSSGIAIQPRDYVLFCVRFVRRCKTPGKGLEVEDVLLVDTFACGLVKGAAGDP